MKFIFPILLFFSYSSSYSQCFSVNGAGEFNQVSDLNEFVVADQGNGSIAITSTDFVSGGASLEADVHTSGDWQVRLLSRPSCYFNVVKGETITLSFFSKSTKVGNSIKIVLMDNTSEKQSAYVAITSDGWQSYQCSFRTTFTSSTTRLKVVFTDIGGYFIDELRINERDCNGTFDGLAAIDSCDICAGGTSGKTFKKTCKSSIITPKNANIIYEGVLDSTLTYSKATLFRFKKSYATKDVAGYYNKTRASASSCIGIRFKTSSPNVKAYFIENTALGPDLFKHEMGIFKNGELYATSEDTVINLNNERNETVEWKFVLPSFSMYEFVKLEVIEGYELEQVTDTNKPIYIAIGNSITQGLGTAMNESYNTYPYMVADSLGYEVYNWANGGSKIYAGILENFNTGIKPNLVTILWGYNDVHYSSSDNYLETTSFPEYDSILNYLCDNHPLSTLMAILPTYTSNPENTPHRTIDKLRDGQLQIIQDLQTSCPNLNYMYGDDYTDASSLNDVVHLTTKGYKDLADGIIAELASTTTVLNKGNKIKLACYPNPSSDIIKIDGLKIGSKYKIYSLRGEKQMVGIYSKKGIDLGSLPKGHYIIRSKTSSLTVLKQ